MVCGASWWWWKRGLEGGRLGSAASQVWCFLLGKVKQDGPPPAGWLNLIMVDPTRVGVGVGGVMHSLQSKGLRGHPFHQLNHEGHLYSPSLQTVLTFFYPPLSPSLPLLHPSSHTGFFHTETASFSFLSLPPSLTSFSLNYFVPGSIVLSLIKPKSDLEPTSWCCWMFFNGFHKGLLLGCHFYPGGCLNELTLFI